VPRLPDEFIAISVMLFGSQEQAANATGPPTGVGCLLQRKAMRASDKREFQLVYVLTNSHVVSGGGRWAKIKTTTDPVVEEISPEGWVHADVDDLAIALLGVNAGYEYVIDFESMIATDEKMHLLNVGYGDDVAAVGSGGEPNSWQPIMRFGNISSWPITKMTDGRKGGHQVEQFLVEMRSRGGDSGSPVFLWVSPGSWRGNGMMTGYDQPGQGFLGIVCGHLMANDDASRNSNVSMVVPYSRITALFNDSQLLERGADLVAALP